MTHRHTCFAEPDGTVARITDQAVAAAERHFARRIAAIRKAITQADDFDAASRNLLNLAARWTPDAFAALLEQTQELAALEGREAVFTEAEDDPAFAEPDFTRIEFRERNDYLRQKRVKPTRVWTDAMAGDHDRDFVVAGVTDLAMLEDFHAAVIEGAKTYDIKAFGAEFDRLVEKYGWSYNGGRDWRVRTIFETNIRTSYMAGRLRQMRDPELLKTRPYWQYLHADTRVPLEPRPEHVAWDGLVLMWNDPWWDVHFPPNDWLCSCGVRTLTRGDLKRLGKDGPDSAPPIVRRPFTHQASGQTVMLPEGVGFGWDHMPGDLWERGLVPSALEGGSLRDLDPRVEIDPPQPVAELLAEARPFAAEPLADGLSDQDYIRAFLAPFGAEIGRGVLWEDPSGTYVPISDLLFRDEAGTWTFGGPDRARLLPLYAETIRDPDEIWIGLAARPDPVDPSAEELVVDRRYVRADPGTGLTFAFEMGRRWWQATSAEAPSDTSGTADRDLRRGGKLLWKRK